MKKIMLAATVIVTLSCNTVLAQKTEATSEANATFNQEFPKATSVSWETAGPNVYLVRFNVQDDNWLAYIDQAGQLKTSGKRISFEQAPMRLQAAVEKIKTTNGKNYGELSVIHIYELIDNETDGTRYYINLGNKNLFMALLSEGNSSIRVLRKSVLKQAEVMDTKMIARE